MEYLQLVYASAATRNVDEQELADILAVSRANNTAKGVTGILLFLEGSFLQVLEGVPDTVTELYDTIALDSRHDDVVLLMRRMVEERGFGEWSMGYVDASRHAEKLEGFFNIMRDYKGFAALKSHQTDVRRIIDGFVDGKWRRTID